MQLTNPATNRWRERHSPGVDFSAGKQLGNSTQCHTSYIRITGVVEGKVVPKYPPPGRTHSHILLANDS